MNPHSTGHIIHLGVSVSLVRPASSHQINDVPNQSTEQIQVVVAFRLYHDMKERPGDGRISNDMSVEMSWAFDLIEHHYIIIYGTCSKMSVRVD